MGREGVEVERQAIARKHWQRIGDEAHGDMMNQLVSEILSPRAEGKCRDELGAGQAIHSHLASAAP
jgi:hypothetical protein